MIDAQVYSREGSKNDARLQAIIEEKRKRSKKDMAVEQNVIRNNALDKLKDLLVGKKDHWSFVERRRFGKASGERPRGESEDLETIRLNF